MTTIDDADTSELRHAFVDGLAHLLPTPWWQTAFRTVPRERFAPCFSIYDPVENAFRRYDIADADPARRAAALAVVYSDDTLITRFDGQGTPVSSSTEPSLMARMLESLDARPGHRVLEIGTGTGYNIALLCAALGDEAVTTIDVDPACVATAGRALAGLGRAPDLRHGDGAAGVPERAPFDRIIATCGVDRVPGAWLTQLAPDGAILVNVSKGIVLLRRADDVDDAEPWVTGRFLGPAGFMPLRTGSDPASATPRDVLRRTDGLAAGTVRLPVPERPDFVAVSFFADLVAPGGRLVRIEPDGERPASYRWLHPASDSWTRVDLRPGQAIAARYGPRDLWSELTPLLLSWDDAGRPEIERYGLTITESGRHTLWLDEPDRRVAVLPN